MFHFDMMHGCGNLSKAIELLDEKEKKIFHYLLKTRYHLILITCLFVEIQKFWSYIILQFFHGLRNVRKCLALNYMVMDQKECMVFLLKDTCLIGFKNIHNLNLCQLYLKI